MKPEILTVGDFIEDQKGKAKISGWHFDGTNADEAFKVGELKSIAVDHRTYSKVEHLDIPPLESFGIVHRNETGEIVGFEGFDTL